MKRVRIILLIFLLLLLALVVTAFVVRESLLHRVINRVVASEKNKHHLDIRIGEASFDGLSAVVLRQISVVPEGKDTLLTVEHFRVQISLARLLTGHIKVKELSSSNGRLLLSHRDSLRNFDFLFKKDSLADTTARIDVKINLARLANNLINKILYKVPDEMEIRDYTLAVIDDNKKFNIHADFITISKHRLQSTIRLNGKEATWHAEGMIDPSDKNLDLRFYAEQKKVELPYIEQKFGLKLSFDTISTRMDRIAFEQGQLKIFGNWSIRNLLINHPKIALDDIVVNHASIDCNMFVGENYVSVDSSSVAFLGQIKAHTFLKYTLGQSKIYEVDVHTDQIPAQDFFNSIPAGLFKSIEGIQVSGSLAYHVNLFLDEQNPWSCHFDAGFVKDNFRINSFGNTNFAKINSDFVYTPFEYGRPARPILVGPGNSDFTPLEQISHYLRDAILTSEDPSFFSHRGFYMEALRQSIATNMVAGRFKRGGSTISMQLVKNVFLNRNKTILRKLEEAMIVWLIENNRISSKERMFEVYLNIIEWAPDVYGIGEASRFYFHKRPSQLSLGESIFLASIVPKPKKFKYSFTGTGQMKPYLAGHFKLISGLMLKRGKINESDTTNLFHSVVLRGPARNYVITDSLSVPAREMNDEMDLLRNLLGE